MIHKVTDKEKFTLSLRGYEYAGHLPFWSITEGELAGIFDDEYTMLTREWNGRTDYVLTERSYYTLGQRIDHKKMVEIWKNIPFKSWKVK